MVKVIGIIGSKKGQYSLVHLIQDVKKEPENQPMHIMINSPGGDVELSFDMHDYLRGLNRQIITECRGQCASAASILFLSGDKRIAGCLVMIHNPWTQAEGDAQELANASKWTGEFEKRTEKFYSEKTGFDQETISNLMKKETYIGVETVRHYLAILKKICRIAFKRTFRQTLLCQLSAVKEKGEFAENS